MKTDKEEIIVKYDFDDKDMAMMSLTVIAIICLFVLAEPVTILTSIISGILGLATGRNLGNK